MAVKTYEINMLGYETTLPVIVNGNKQYITFKKASIEDGTGYLHTDKRDIQIAIEGSEKFTSGIISLTSGTVEEVENTLQPITKVHGGVTDFMDAREILMRDYGVLPQAVQKSPHAVQTKAEELGISFPDLNVD